MNKEEMIKDLGVEVFETGDKNDAFAKYFTGQSYLNMLNMEGVSVGNVTFEPNCRNNWHIHHKGGQILLVTGGKGIYQEAGSNARMLKMGDVVYIAPEVKHWHGAQQDRWFAHVAIEIPSEGGNTEWLEPVEDEAYFACHN
ncbi:cupin domain-containing protein [Amedibacillus sp. YH-ame10]